MRDGRTLCFDLENEEQVSAWLDRVRSPEFQSTITGLTLSHNGVQYSLPRPKGFDSLFMFAENVGPDAERGVKGGERIICHAGEVSVNAVVHSQQKAVRVNVTRQGIQRYNPLTR